MNSMTSNKSDRESVHSSNGHISKNESDAFTHRVLEVIGEEDRHSFARRSGVGESTLRNIIKSGAWPRTDNLIAIADAANVNIEWLAAGRGPKVRGAQPGPVEKLKIPLEDINRLRMAIEGYEEGMSLMKREHGDFAKRARLIAGSYELLAQKPEYTKDDVVRMIRIALSYGQPL